LLKLYLIAIAFGLLVIIPKAQIQVGFDQDVSPAGGIEELAIKFYQIEFSPEQRTSLKDIEVEFVFQVDALGNSRLAAINGVSDKAILDSLYAHGKENLLFNPRIEKGVAVSSLYFLMLTFPTYQRSQNTFGLLHNKVYRKIEIDDFEYVKMTNQRFDILYSGAANQFLGRPARYSKFGGGMKVELIYTNKHAVSCGIQMNAYGNRKRRDYPLNSDRVQNNAPVTTSIGVVVGKWIKEFNFQFEMNWAVKNITPRLNEFDNEWVQLRGWNPSVIVHYALNLGKPKPFVTFGEPEMVVHNLNLHAGLRYFRFDLKAATGLMAEIGVGYRFATLRIQEYRLK
jgi:hypothetical protein